MFFVMYKFIITWLLPPGIFIILFWGIGILLVLDGLKKKENSKKRNVAIVLSFISGIILYFGSISPVKNFIAKKVEKEAIPIQEEKLKDVDCIIVLGSGINEVSPVSFNSEIEKNGFPRYSALVRLIEAIKIYNKTKEVYCKNIKIIVSGGVVFKGHRAEADVYKNFLLSMNVEEKDIIVENKSKTTFENSLLSKKIIEKEKFQKVILVTSAAHMKRGVKSFKKLGIRVLPAPCDFINDEYKYDLMSFAPSADNIVSVIKCVWEIIGNIVYDIKGM